ncbi:MAG TPA: hypothetical protein VH418_04725 [Solirubrobacteraceae bacterium]|jgi:hypothetical protein
MALDNADELSAVLEERERLGKVFARHAYGMRAWVDLFSARVPEIEAPEVKALVATLVADNARHMMLFRERAAALGVDPDAYACPPEGEAIYDRIPELVSVDDLLGYALGSLEHFDELLAVYRVAAAGADAAASRVGAAAAGVDAAGSRVGVAAGDADAAAIDSVRADVARMRRDLRARLGPAAPLLTAEAHERYRVRELAETPLYAHAA